MTLDQLPDVHVLTVGELAGLLRCGRRQTYALLARGDIYSRKIGKSIRIPRTAVLRYLEGEENENDRQQHHLAVVQEEARTSGRHPRSA